MAFLARCARDFARTVPRIRSARDAAAAAPVAAPAGSLGADQRRAVGGRALAHRQWRGALEPRDRHAAAARVAEDLLDLVTVRAVRLSGAERSVVAGGSR